MLPSSVRQRYFLYLAGIPANNYFTFSTISTSLQRFVLLRGRDSMIFTISPMLHSFFSSWA
jgi:hypothetical protein